MTDSITHVSGREKPPTDVIPLRAGDLCPPFIFAGVWGRVHARSSTWTPASVNPRSRRARGEERTDTGWWLMEKFSPQRKPLYHLSIVSPFLPSGTSLLLDLRQWSSPSLYLEFIWCGSRGWNRARVNLKLSRPARGEILERKPYRGARIPPPGPVRRISVDAISFKKFNRSCFRG